MDKSSVDSVARVFIENAGCDVGSWGWVYDVELAKRHVVVDIVVERYVALLRACRIYIYGRGGDAFILTLAIYGVGGGGVANTVDVARSGLFNERAHFMQTLSYLRRQNIINIVQGGRGVALTPEHKVIVDRLVRQIFGAPSSPGGGV